MGCRVLPEEPSGCQCFASVVRLLKALRVLPQTGGTARRRIPALSFVVPIRPHGEVGGVRVVTGVTSNMSRYGPGYRFSKFPWWGFIFLVPVCLITAIPSYCFSLLLLAYAI